MKQHALTIAALAVATLGMGAAPALAEVNITVNLTTASAPLAYNHEPPRRHHPRFRIHRKPRFIYTPRLGFSVSIGNPYDMIHYGGRYYLYDRGHWYSAHRYNGPWRYVEHRHLPRRIRRFRHHEIRRYRDGVCGIQHRDRRDWRNRRDRRYDRRDRYDWHDHHR